MDMRNPCNKLGWYKCQSVEVPMSVTNHVEREEEFYQQAVSPKEKHDDWRMLMTSLKEKTSYLCNNEVFSDFVISPKLEQDRKFPVHRFILALRSDFFRTMFYGLLQSGNESEHHVHASENATKKLLRFMYADEIPSTDDVTELTEIMHLAEEYMIYPLRRVCERPAVELLNNDNACLFFQTSYILGLDNLMNYCVEYYKTNFENFLSSPYFVSLNMATVQSLYSVAININRKNNFTPYLMEWCKFELKRRGWPYSDLPTVLKPFMLLHTE